MNKRTIASEAYISCICYSLVGSNAYKIQPKTLHLLCTRVIEDLNNNYDSKLNIIYSANSLLAYIKSHSNSFNNYTQIFYNSLDENQCLVFQDESNSYINLIHQLGKLMSAIPHNLFTDIYPHILCLIEAYQLIDVIDSEDN